MSAGSAEGDGRSHGEGGDTGGPSAVTGRDTAFGPALRELRHRRLLTQTKLAERSGLSVRTVRYLENGQVGRPHSDTLMRLTEALHLRPSDQLLLQRAAGLKEQPVATTGGPSTLPPSSPDFFGREAEVNRLSASLLRGSGDDGTMAVSAISGQPGVGKTALALNVAHRLRKDGQFPDGQLYVDLLGASGTPADPKAVLGRFLSALGVDASAIPPDDEGRVDCYRTLLQDRRVLVVLDNAISEEQIRPLLPGAGHSAVLIATRKRLLGVEGVDAIGLDALDADTAVALLARIVGAQRVSREPVAASRIIDHCDGLPLALRIVGTRLSDRREWTLAHFADRLEDERSRLDELETGDLAVRASFALTYGVLSPPARQLFRRLALLDLPDLPAWLAAPLTGATHAGGLRLIETLHAAHLVEGAGTDPLGQDRYRLQNLLKLYAAELARDEPQDRQRETLSRVMGLARPDRHRRRAGADRHSPGP